MLRALLAAATLLLVACDRAAPATRKTAGLVYTLTPPSSFAMLRQTDKTQTWTPSDPGAKPGETVLVLTRSGKVYPADDRVRRLSPEEMIKGVNNVTQQVILSNDPITIDGMPGHEVTAKALLSGGSPVRVYCVALFAADGTFYVMGYRPGDSAAVIDDFRAAAHSLVVK